MYNIVIFEWRKKTNRTYLYLYIESHLFLLFLVLVQDKRNGRVFTVVDNRSALMAKKMAGGNQEGQTVLANLLGGGKSN